MHAVRSRHGCRFTPWLRRLSTYSATDPPAHTAAELDYEYEEDEPAHQDPLAAEYLSLRQLNMSIVSPPPSISGPVENLLAGAANNVPNDIS